MILVQHHYDEEDGALISRSRSAVDSRAVDLGRGWKKRKRKKKENDANKKTEKQKKN